MQISKIFCFLLLFILSHKQVFAEKKSYVVYLGGHSHGPQITSADLQRVTNSHVDLLSSFVGSKKKAKDVMFYSYQRHINGFAAILEEEEAANIAKHPGVVSVFPNTLLKLHTSHSWDFLGLEKAGKSYNSSLWRRSNFGEDVIIAHIDTGVWPESESFSDTGYGPVPSRWKGVCVNDTKSGVPCNRKIIGARYFINGYNASDEPEVVPIYMQTPRDYDGHGTHTLSTSSGNFVDASLAGVPVGTIKGGSPKARVAMYKVCWGKNSGCSSADILQAFDYAIDDGADVISISIGFGGFLSGRVFDSTAIGSFHAMMKNIVVSASAGNSGISYSVSNGAPWIITVGASTMDRSFTSAVLLSNGLKLQGGGSISKPMAERKYYPIIYAGDAKAAKSSFLNATECIPGSLDQEKVRGQILVCLRSSEVGDDRGIAASDAGAVGMILCNKESDGDFIPSHMDYLPSVQISYKNSVLLFKYMNSTNYPLGFISDTHTKFGLKPSPAMASFSSGGPNGLSLEILKPDITAPGHGIIASFSPAAKEGYGGDDFAMLSGTSMSCPHVTGVVGLLKKLHPDWSPAAIRSALMTTARTRDNTGKPMMKAYAQYTNKTTPYFYGAGHIRPNRAANPGLVYDLTVDDHLNFLCAVGFTQERIQLISGRSYVCPKDISVRHLNHPSISVGSIAAASSSGVTVSRTLKNVDAFPATYSVTIRSPPGVSVTVDPKILRFKKVGDERSFKLTMKVKGNLTFDAFGDLVWSDGIRHRVRSPLVLVAGI